jgi:hypothetical protein
MKQITLVIGHNERETLLDAWLSSNGVSTEKKYILTAERFIECETPAKVAEAIELLLSECTFVETRTMYVKG